MTSIDNCFTANQRDLMATVYTVEDAEFIQMAEENNLTKQSGEAK